MRSARALLPACLIGALLLASCRFQPVPLPATPLPPTPSPALPVVAIEAPAGGAQLPPAPVILAASGTAAGDNALFEWTVDGTVLGSAVGAGSGGVFRSRYTWTPPGPGRYALEVRLVDAGGRRSAPARVAVTVVRPTSTPLPTRQATVLPDLSASATPPGIRFDRGSSSDLFQYDRYCRADPGRITLGVFVRGSDQVAGVELFYHLQNTVTGEKSPWNEGVGMQQSASGEYTYSLSWEDIPDLQVIAEDGDAGYFLHQYVAVDARGQVLGRSLVYSDITLMPCLPLPGGF